MRWEEDGDQQSSSDKAWGSAGTGPRLPSAVSGQREDGAVAARGR